MTCLLPSGAEGITVADITLRYVHCCYMVAELYLFTEIPSAFREIFLSCLIFKPFMIWTLSLDTAVPQVADGGTKSRCTE